jgi:hypothetical protein
MDDERGEPYQQYSARMARAYNQTRHFRTGELTNPEEAFQEVLKMAVEKEADLFAMTGDIFSFPSEAAIEWLKGKVEESGLKYLFVSGNHDWHYEGMEGSIHHLRETWINKRLTDLYQGKDPMMAAYDIKGITVLAIDNATYEIMPGQLNFFKDHVSSAKPLMLMMHIPMYAPGRSTGYGCGHPVGGPTQTGIISSKGVKDGLKRGIQRLQWTSINRFLLHLTCLVYLPGIPTGRRSIWLKGYLSLLPHQMQQEPIWRLIFCL